MRTLDLNVEAAHWLLDRPQVEDLAIRLGLRFLGLNRAQVLDFDEQREYRALVEARSGIEWVLDEGPSPVEVFRSREMFLDPARYSLARRKVEAYFEALSAVHFPYRFDFNQAAHEVAPWSLDLLDRYRKDRSSPLHELYRRALGDSTSGVEPGDSQVPGIDLQGVGLVGISVAFPSQIPEAFYLAAMVEERDPNVFVALGGPCITQIALRVEAGVLRRILEKVDGICIFEGEETLAHFLEILPAWRGAGGRRERFDIVRSVPNLLVLDPDDRAVTGPFARTELANAPAPDFSDVDLDRYLAPSRTILYSPTRGCYWNRCSFCHYGLAETGTAPYREIPPELAVSQLARLLRKHGVRNVYLACDVLSPSWAIRFARALIDRGLKIRWSTDLKVEATYTPETCELLYRSGLRAAAFGVESGSDRMLAVIGKGSDRRRITEVTRAFHAAGVATEWMTFTDHPGETSEEALETVRWIQAEGDHVDLFIVGEFGLEHGSDIARSPARYGVERIYWAAGDDLRMHALWTQRGGRRSDADRARVDASVRKAAAPYALRPYPWAGAVSTHHTFLHFLEFGPGVFRRHFQRAGRETEAPLGEPPPSHIAGLREWARFSVDTIRRRSDERLAEYLPRALEPVPVPGEDGRLVAPLSEEHYRRWTASVDSLRA